MKKIVSNIPRSLKPVDPFINMARTQELQDGGSSYYMVNDYCKALKYEHSIKNGNTIYVEEAYSVMTAALNEHEQRVEEMAAQANTYAQQYNDVNYQYILLVDGQQEHQEFNEVVCQEQELEEENYHLRETNFEPSYTIPQNFGPDQRKVTRFHTNDLNEEAYKQIQFYCRSIKHRRFPKLDKNLLPKYTPSASMNILGMFSKMSVWAFWLVTILGVIAEATSYHYCIRNIIGMGEGESVLYALGAFALFFVLGVCFSKASRNFLVSNTSKSILFLTTAIIIVLMVLGFGSLNHSHIRLKSLQTELLDLKEERATPANELKLSDNPAPLQQEVDRIDKEIASVKQQIKRKKSRSDWVGQITLALMGLSILLASSLLKSVNIIVGQVVYLRHKKDKAHKEFLKIQKTYRASVKTHYNAYGLLTQILFRIARKHEGEKIRATGVKMQDYIDTIFRSTSSNGTTVNNSNHTTTLNTNGHENK